MNVRAVSIASALHAANNLRRLIEARYLFPGDLDDETCPKAFRTFTETLEASLNTEELQPLRSQYERPHIENKEPPGSLHLIYCACLGILIGEKGLQLSQQMDKKAMSDVYQASSDNVMDPLREAILGLEYQLAFNCRFPHPPDDDAYLQPERLIFLLGVYSDLYNDILQLHGSSPIGFTPHPLLRYIENLRFRIQFCLDRIADEGLATAFQEMLSIELDLDSNAVWEEWAQPIITRTFQALERYRTLRSVPLFKLVDAEELFVRSTRLGIDHLREMIAKEWKSCLQRVEREAAKHSVQTTPGPRTPFEFIRLVETKLRELVSSSFRARFGTQWLLEIEAVIGDEAYQAAVATMKQRGVDQSKELLHFTNFPDVYNIVSQRWDCFAQYFLCNRREFNKLMQPILKGRTEEAHNRPDHLWPEIEKDRVKVSCHDLLSKMKSSE